jgi:hypothetical protein
MVVKEKRLLYDWFKLAQTNSFAASRSDSRRRSERKRTAVRSERKKKKKTCMTGSNWHGILRDWVFLLFVMDFHVEDKGAEQSASFLMSSSSLVLAN